GLSLALLFKRLLWRPPSTIGDRFATPSGYSGRWGLGGDHGADCGLRHALPNARGHHLRFHLSHYFTGTIFILAGPAGFGLRDSRPLREHGSWRAPWRHPDGFGLYPLGCSPPKPIWLAPVPDPPPQTRIGQSRLGQGHPLGTAQK